MKIFLIGPQGSGKSTQGKLLAQFLKTPFIVTGDLLREVVSSNSEEGKRIKQLLEAGDLVDDATVAKLIRERIQKDDCRDGFILDGYPRNLEQARRVEDLNFDKAIYFKISKNVVVERLLKRGREDDTEDLIKKRLDIYYEQTEPLLEYFKDKGILMEISGEGEIENIQSDLRKSLGNES